MYKGHPREKHQKGIYSQFVRTKQREGKRREKKGVERELYWTKLLEEPTRYEENYSLYKLILISLSLISLGAGDSRLAPYMFVFWSLPELIAAQITPI